MSRRSIVALLAWLTIVGLVFPGLPSVGGTRALAAGGGGGGDRGTLTPIRLQLQWSAQAQFAGYYAAKDLGYYAAEGLDVTILEGGPDIVPQDAVAAGQAELGIAWVPKALVTRAGGGQLVNVAQVFQRSGTRQVSWVDTGITRPEDWRGRRIGTWGLGNEYELYAAMRQAGIDPDRDVTIVPQPFDMELLLTRQIDAAQAQTYNEYAQVLEAVNPATGRLDQPEDLSIIDFNALGTAMLQDAVWAREDWLAESGNADLTTRFLRASFRGWIYCRDNFDACVDIVMRNGPSLGRGHQTWQLNEVNRLIWPSPEGIGLLDQRLWDQTVRVATGEGVLPRPPDAGAARRDLARSALADLTAEGIDVRGAGYQARRVAITPGGR